MSFWKKSNFEQLSIEIKIDKLHELNTVVGALTKRECAAGGGERLFFSRFYFFLQGCISCQNFKYISIYMSFWQMIEKVLKF